MRLSPLTVTIAAVCACALSTTETKPLLAAQGPSPPAYEMALQEAWIEMPDGVRLAADLFLPAGGEPGERFPVILEYIPYRKDEARDRSHSFYSYFVPRGYVVARVDIRGSGNSEGKLIEYEYTDQEQRDAEVVIDWLSKQAFADGNVGMFGISWGGFNSIHMAMRNPPALKAIIAIQATDDLYQDDIHFIDGMMHVDSYEIGQDLANAIPGAPGFVIDEKYFRERFDTTPWLLIYKRQQRDGPFWDRASLNTDYSRIKIPTFVIGGWYDGYRDSVPRMLEHLQAPVKGLIGPWGHSLPHQGYPKPQIEWRHEAVRWFDHWLKGRDTGIMDEPRFAVYVRYWHPPDPHLEEAPGEWRWEEGWPIERTRYRTLYPHPDHSLAPSVPEGDVHHLRYIPTVGIEAGGPVMWWGDMAPDQRPTDAFSLVYDTEPLEEDLEILGLPQVLLNASADAPLAHWLVRLSDVAPDGTVTQVAGAGLNGAHRSSAERPEALEPGRIYPLEIEMHFTSWVFPKGHRIRLAVNNSQWPMIWPTPHLMTTSLRLGGERPTRLVLPVMPPERRPAPEFLAPAEYPTLPGYGDVEGGTISGYGEIAIVERDERRKTTKVTATNGNGYRYPWGSEEYSERIIHEAEDAQPALTSVRSEASRIIKLEDRTLEWEGLLFIRSDRENFYYVYTRRILENDVLVREKTWKETIPRDHQ